MMAGHSVLASSASQPFLFDQDHTLIETSSSGSSEEALVSEMNMFIPITLRTCLLTFNLIQGLEKYILLEWHAPKNLGRGCHPIAWVKSLIEKSCTIQSMSPLSYSANVVVNAFQKGLVPFRTPLDNRPDGVILGYFNVIVKSGIYPFSSWKFTQAHTRTLCHV